VILGIIAAIAGLYQLFAIIACFKFRRAVEQASGFKRGLGPGPASILKPVTGIDEGLRPAIESHSKLHGDYELLCGVRSMQDPALAVLREYPCVRIIECHTRTRNGKVGVLIDLAQAAQHSILVVNDADIRVDQDYLERVTAPLSDPRVGLVTCLYRPEGSTFAARFEGLGVSTDFAPSTLVGWLIGLDEFAGGSTLAFRRADLDRIGGFEPIGDYLADDYQLGSRMRALGLKCHLSEAVVSTYLGGGWRDVWLHQIRWARTIRVSNFPGYLSLPVTFGTVWGLAAVAAGAWPIGLATLAARMAMATVGGWLVIRSPDVLRLWFLIPVRDLFAAVVWAVGLFGNTVLWRGERLRLDKQGRIKPASQ
jgi:ceramide glucosyltransferase